LDKRKLQSALEGDMATVLVTTSLDLNAQKKKEVIAALGAALAEVFKTHSLYFQQFSPSDVEGGAVNQTTIYVHVPPYMEIERKRILVKKLHDTLVEHTGYQGELKNIVLFKYHDDDGCGVDGVLRSDAKAAQAKE
jgi:phenylpyruvate tautomerase PptA (4-oxalocrotonate tautomerase family)